MAEDKPVKLIKPQSLITEEHVKNTLLKDKGKEAVLDSWEVVDFTRKGDNYASVVSSVQVKYTLGGQAQTVSYIVKLNPCRGFEDFEVFNEFIFAKESRFYLELIPELNQILTDHGLDPLRVPPCLYGSLEKLKQQIYLSDMRPKGFKMVDKKYGMDLAHASLVLTELGKFHAASLLLEDKTKEAVEVKHDFLNIDFFDVESYKDMRPLMESYLDTSIKMLEKVRGYERAIAWAESLKPRLDKLLSEGLKSEGFNVVNHGDCWNNNIIFRYNDEGMPVEVILLDLQICRKASLAIDLNYFMYTSMNGDFRKNNLEKLLSIYYKSFKGIMEAGGLEVTFNEKDLLKEFRSKNVIGGYFAMMIVPIILLEADEVPDMVGNDMEDVKRIMDELRARAMEMIDKNPIMKPRFLAMFDEFMETGLIP